MNDTRGLGLENPAAPEPSGVSGATGHDSARRCLGYIPLRDIAAGEVTGWPPPVAPNGPWIRCPACAADERAAEAAALIHGGDAESGQ